MLVIVGGARYEIDGIVYGTVPVWRLIKQDGVPMTHETFDKLPDGDKQTLAAHVHQHIKQLQGG